MDRWTLGGAAAGAREEWRATTKHDGAEVESILIDKAKPRRDSPPGLVPATSISPFN